MLIDVKSILKKNRNLDKLCPQDMEYVACSCYHAFYLVPKVEMDLFFFPDIGEFSDITECTEERVSVFERETYTSSGGPLSQEPDSVMRSVLSTEYE